MIDARATLMLIDDERFNINVLRHLLEPHYGIMVARNGPEALTRLAATPHLPDLILLDIMMPDMDGYEVLRRLKADPLTADIPVIFVSAMDSVTDESRGLAMGAADYVTKPIMPELLQRRIATQLMVGKQRDLHALMQTITDTTGEGIVITDSKGIIVEVNPAYEQLMGYTRDEVIGKRSNATKSGRHDASFYQAMWQCLHETGQWSGEIWDRRKNGDIFPKQLSIRTVRNASGHVTHYVGVFLDLSHQKASEARLAQLSFHDPLTGLANRVLFRNRLEQALTTPVHQHRHTGLLLLNLDRFKWINDTFGYPAGDALLTETGGRLTLACGVLSGTTRHTVCRLGGDEFAIVLADMATPEDLCRLVVALVDILARPCVIQEQTIPLAASIGITLAPGDGQDFETLTRNADLAMDAAKTTPRTAANIDTSIYRFFTADLETRHRQRIAMEQDLRTALAQNHFRLVYQPKIDLRDHTIHAAECLIRWAHPEQGMISPATFIPLAEETGLVVHVGTWVLRTACQQMQQWRRTDPESSLATLRLAVNLSAQQFQDPHLLSSILSILRDTGLPPDALELEITESVIVADIDQTVATMKTMKDAGLTLAIDDFGTGYSSLNYLKRFPIDTLKIDQSFVRELTECSDDAAIVRAIISLANALGLEVVAEGVETVEQYAFLAHLQCEQIQGYYFSRPLSAEAFATFVRQHETTPHPELSLPVLTQKNCSEGDD
jgi:diguanylate cyclase (GGDEF)-like protein/PAS domain S-box-containing protein